MGGDGANGGVRTEIRAGLQVFLLALPLCLGIAAASGAPPVAGLITAIVGGLLTGARGGARATIKGPAAGLIVIVAGCIAAFGGGVEGYRAMLAVGVAAGLLQLGLSIGRAGRLLRFVPPAVVHGMLAAIGVLIILKQLPALLGVPAGGEGVVGGVVYAVTQVTAVDPRVLAVGAAAVATLALHPRLPAKAREAFPAPLAAVVASVGAAAALALPVTLESGAAPFVDMPGSLLAAIVTPDYAVLLRPEAWWWVVLFAIVGSLESLLSVRAVDALAEQESDLDADLRSVAVGNVLAALIGGLPMITEVVRSSACVAYGGRGHLANRVHGAALLLALALFAEPLRWVPEAALAVLLVHVGTRLASADTFRQEIALGYDQLLIFGATFVGCVTVDLLVGVGVGVGLKLLLHVLHGAPLASLWRPDLAVDRRGGQTTLRVRDAAVFSSFHHVRDAALAAPAPAAIDLGDATLVDHTVMVELDRLREHGVAVVGLERFAALGPGATASRVKRPLPVLAWAIPGRAV